MTSVASAPDELSLLRELVAALQKENSLLRQKVDALVKKVFGSSSERIDPAQLELLMQLSGALAAPKEQVAPIAPPPAEEAPQRQKLQRAPRIPENLPVVEQVLEPAEVKDAPEQWRLIGQEISEQLDYEPGRFLCRRIVRRKYVHVSDPDRAPIIAPLPEKLQDRGLAGAGLLTHILVSKYCDHLPLYRQEQIFAQRHKINLPRQTLARWVQLAVTGCTPFTNRSAPE